MPGAIPLVVGGIGVGAAGALVHTQLKAQKKARERAEAIAAEQARLQREQLKKIEETRNQEAADRVRDQAKELQRRRAASASGRRSTILTSPVGVTGATPGTGKTLTGV